jgi:hypothetical protein
LLSFLLALTYFATTEPAAAQTEHWGSLLVSFPGAFPEATDANNQKIGNVAVKIGRAA